MDTLEAKQVLHKHALGTDLQGVELPEMDSLSLCLRPYRGINEEHFIEVLESLVTLSGEINSSESVDRETIYLLWELTRFARCATRGPHEPMYHGREFISPDDKKLLDEWVWMIESATIHLLRGHTVSDALGDSMADYICRHTAGSEYAFLNPLFIESLEEVREEEGLVEFEMAESLCRAIAAIQNNSDGTISVLEKVVETSKSAEVRNAARMAIESLRG